MLHPTIIDGAMRMVGGVPLAQVPTAAGVRTVQGTRNFRR